MAVIGEAEVRVVPDTRGFGKDVEEQVEAPVTKAAKRMGIALAAAFSAQAVGSFFKDAVAAASSAEEATSKVGVVFGEASESVLAFADDSAEAFGQSSTQALEAAGNFGNLFRAIGLTEEKSAEFATSLTGLASDLASFNDVEVDDALLALRSGLVGEAEPLRRFGVSLSAARIEAKAFELGLASTKDEVNESVKAQAAYAIILEDTALAQGDFARTSEGLANSQRILAAEFEDAKTELGTGLLPLASELVAIASADLIPLITELGEVAVPLLSLAFETAAPFLGTTVTLMEALLPVVQVVADGLDKIPAPLLQMVTLGLAFNKVVGPLSAGLGTAATGARLFTEQIGKSGLQSTLGQTIGSLSKMQIGIGAAVGALSAGLLIYEGATKAGKEYDAAVQDIAKSLTEATESQETFNDVIEGVLAPLDELNQTELTILDRIGKDIQDFKDAAVGGGDVLDPLTAGLRDLGVEIETGATKAQIAAAVYESELQAKYPGFAQQVEEFANKYEDLDDQLDEGAAVFLRREAATGALVAAEQIAVDSAIEIAEETGNWQEAALGLEEILGPVTEKTDAVATSAEEAVEPVIDLTGAISDLRDGLLDSTEELDNYLTAVSEAFGVELDYEDSILAVSDAVDDVTSATLDLIAARGDQGARDLAIAEQEVTEAVAAQAAVYADAEATQGDKLRADEAVADAQRNLTEQTGAAVEAERALADEQRAAVDTVLAAEEAIRAKSDAENAGLSDTEKAAAANAAVREEIDKVAATLDPNSTLAKNLAGYRDDLGEVTGVFETQVDADTELAQAAVNNWAADLEKRTVIVPVDARLTGGTEADVLLRALVPGFAEGFYGTTTGPMPFIAGEAGAEDVLVVPTAIGGIAKVVSDLASQVAGDGGRQTPGGGVVISPGAIQVVAGPDSSPQAIAREVIDRLGYELTVRGDA